MRVLFDTNVLLDALLSRKPFVADAVFLLEAVKAKKISGFLSATTATDIHYVVRKQTKSANKATAAVVKLMKLMNVCLVDRAILEQAIALSGTDFEDDVQLSCALSSGLDTIVTRDDAGFSTSPLLITSPTNLRKLLTQQEIS